MGIRSIKSPPGRLGGLFDSCQFCTSATLPPQQSRAPRTNFTAHLVAQRVQAAFWQRSAPPSMLATARAIATERDTVRGIRQTTLPRWMALGNLIRAGVTLPH